MGWTVGWTVGWTLGGRWGDGIKKFGTGWPRKVRHADEMVTEAGRDGHGSWTGWSRKLDGKRSKSKDLLYGTRSCNEYREFFAFLTVWLAEKSI